MDLPTLEPRRLSNGFPVLDHAKIAQLLRDGHRGEWVALGDFSASYVSAIRYGPLSHHYPSHEFDARIVGTYRDGAGARRATIEVRCRHAAA